MREISAQAISNRLKDTTIITQADRDDLKTLAMMEYADHEEWRYR